MLGEFPMGLLVFSLSSSTDVNLGSSEDTSSSRRVLMFHKNEKS